MINKERDKKKRERDRENSVLITTSYIYEYMTNRRKCISSVRP